MTARLTPDVVFQRVKALRDIEARQQQQGGDTDHTGPDGYQRRCPYCRGETSPVAWNDSRMSCDECGEVLPCCQEVTR